MEMSPRQGDQLATAAGVWNTVNVTATGPIENGGAYTFVKSATLNGWVYVPPLIAPAVNETAIACIANGKQAYIETTPTTPPVMLRFHLLA